MNPTHATAFTVMLAAALGSMVVTAPARAAHGDAGRRPTRYFNLVNATFDSVTALAIAPADGDGFHDIDLGKPLQGGLNSMTFDVPGGGCLRDIRVTFHGGRTLLYPHIDVCRYEGLRLKPQDNRPAPSVASSSGD